MYRFVSRVTYIPTPPAQSRACEREREPARCLSFRDARARVSISQELRQSQVLATRAAGNRTRVGNITGCAQRCRGGETFLGGDFLSRPFVFFLFRYFGGLRGRRWVQIWLLMEDFDETLIAELEFDASTFRLSCVICFVRDLAGITT